MTDDLAKVLLKMTWEQMDDFASYIVQVATNDADEPNDERYIAQCMIGTAQDTLVSTPQ